MYCKTLDREIESHECVECWGCDSLQDFHQLCKQDNLRRNKSVPLGITSCMYPTIQLDWMCDGCPVYDECELGCKGKDLLYGTKARRERAK